MVSDGPVKRAFWMGFGLWRLTLSRGGLRWERTELVVVGFGVEEEYL